MLNIKDLYDDYLNVCEMHIDPKVKIRLITVLLSISKDSWQVIGITTSALEKFKKNNFLRTSGIQRAHWIPRSTFLKDMQEKNFNDDLEWWKFYKEFDKTILALSKENSRIQDLCGSIISIEPGYFKNGSCGWIHGPNERKYLETLYKKYQNGQLEISSIFPRNVFLK